MRPSGRIATLVLLAYPLLVPAQDIREAVDGFVDSHQKVILTSLLTALEFPAVAAHEAHIRRKTGHLRSQLDRRGFFSQILETAGNSLVFGELSA